MKSPTTIHLAKKHKIVEQKFGYTIEDNFRYFEDTKNQEALDWIKEESNQTQAFLNEDNLSEKIAKELEKAENILNFRLNQLKTTAKNYYYTKRKNSDKKFKLYQYNKQTDTEKLLFDLKKLEDLYPNQSIQLMNYSVSPNEHYLAVLLCADGNEFGNMHIYDLKQYQFSTIIHYKSRSFKLLWLNDKEYLYHYFPNANKSDGTSFQDIEIKYHEIGTSLDEDYVFCSEKNNPEIKDLGETNWFHCEYITKTNSLYLYHSRDTEEKVAIYKKDFNKKQLTAFQHIAGFDQDITCPTIFDGNLYYFSSKNKDKYELRRSDVNEKNFSLYELVFASVEEFVSLEMNSDEMHLFFTTTVNGYNKLYTINKNKVHEIKFEEKGSITLSYYNKNSSCPIVFTNFKKPSIYYIYKNSKLEELPIQKNQIKNADVLNELIIETKEYQSHDGTLVPISLVYHKSLKKDGTNKCLINAYGSYGYIYQQYFDCNNLYWLIDAKAVLAIAHVRGGGEKGKRWYEAGKKENKANTWLDLIWAGKYMVSEKYSSPEKLACQGTSAGGITVGMAAIYEPSVFKSILSNVGSNTVSRRGKNPGGGLSEFGNPHNEEDFKHLLAMDVYENIKEKKYPNILLSAGMQDDRVDYWQPAKAAAKFKLQNTTDTKIAYITYDKFGHGWCGNKKLNFKYLANQYAFLLKTLE